MKKYIAFFIMAVAASCVCCHAFADNYRPRTIVTSDGEVDDMDSFVRLLLYSNDMQIEGLVYSASQFHWAGDGKGTMLKPQNKVQGGGGFGGFGPRNSEGMESMRWLGTSWMQEYIDLYAEVYPNLVKHDSNYPSPDYLKSVVRVGNIMVEGDLSAPSEGSEFIKSIILDDKPGPVYIQAWGGPNTAARALMSIEEEFKGKPGWDEVYRKVSDKVIFTLCLEQDGTYRNYIAKAWPEIRVVHDDIQFNSFAYLWNRQIPEPYLQYVEGPWNEENILKGHGPLAGRYFTWGDGHVIDDPADRYGDPAGLERSGRKKYDFISEGDTPTYLMIMDFGLRSTEDPAWGGVGGRYIPTDDEPRGWKDPGTMDFSMLSGPGPGGPGGQRPPREEKPKVEFDRTQGDYNPFKDDVDSAFPQTRWVPVIQNDFAARADWCVMSYDEANHRPQASVAGPLDLTVKAGKKVKLKGAATDPDGDKCSLRWWQYREAGSCDLPVTLKGAESAKASFKVPADAPSGSTIHIILEVKDEGTPALTHFQRVVITVK